MHPQTANPLDLNPLGQKPDWANIDRWVFVAMAALLFVTVLVGFIPSSIGKVAAVEAGQRAPFLPILHVHAVLMGSWILLLMVQTSLIASNNSAMHKKLGLVSLVLMPAIVVTGFILVPSNFAVIWSLDPTIVPSAVIAETKIIISNIALLQFRVGILFPVFIGLALYFRKTDSDTHKRLMILAVIATIPAAINRITWVPHSLPEMGFSPDLYTLLFVLPLFTYDLLRHKRIQRAYTIWVIAWLPCTVLVNLFWGSEWWLATVPKLMGVESW